MSENNEHLLSMNLVVCDSCSGKYVFNCKVFSKSIIWNVIIWCLLVGFEFASYSRQVSKDE